MRATAVLATTALLTAGALACRPAVEERIPCARDGDFSCPTGWHCGPEGTCVPGERSAAIALDAPEEDAVLSGTAVLRFRATAARGIGPVRVSLSCGEVTLVLDSRVSLELSDEGRRARGMLDVETFRLEDGPCELAVEVASRQGGPPSTEQRRLVIANKRPALSLEEAPGDRLASPLTLPIRVESLVGVREVFALFGPEPMEVQARWSDEDRLAGTLDVTADPRRLPDGPAILQVVARDRAGREGILQVAFEIGDDVAD